MFDRWKYCLILLDGLMCKCCCHRRMKIIRKYFLNVVSIIERRQDSQIAQRTVAAPTGRHGKITHYCLSLTETRQSNIIVPSPRNVEAIDLNYLRSPTREVSYPVVYFIQYYLATQTSICLTNRALSYLYSKWSRLLLLSVRLYWLLYTVSNITIYVTGNKPMGVLVTDVALGLVFIALFINTYFTQQRRDVLGEPDSELWTLTSK